MSVVKHGWNGQRRQDGREQTACGMWIRDGCERSEGGGVHVFAALAQVNCKPCESAERKAMTGRPAYV